MTEPRGAPASASPLGRLVRDIAAYGAGDLLLKAASFLTFPIYTRLFSTTDYGKFAYVSTGVSFLAAILALGGETAFTRFYFEAKTDDERRAIASSWFGFLGAWTVVVAVALLPLSSALARASFGDATDRLLYALAILGVPVTLISTFLGQVLRNQFRAKLFTLLNVATTTIGIGLSLWAVIGLRLGVAGVLAGTLVAGVLVLPVRIWAARDLLRPVFEWRWVREMLAFGVPLVPTGIAYWVFSVSDRILLGKLSTMEQVGLYSAANSITSLLGLAYLTIGQAWTPHAMRLYESDPEEARHTFGRLLTHILVGFGFATVAFTAFAHEGLRVLSTAEFLPAAAAVGPLSLGFLGYASTAVTALSISLRKRTKYLALYSWVAAVLNVLLNLLLVPRWGMVAAGWSTAAAYLVLTVCYAVQGQRMWRIDYELRNAAVLGTITLAAVLLLPRLDAVAAAGPALIGLKLACCLAYLGLLAIFGVLDLRAVGSLLRDRRQRAVTIPAARTGD